MSPHTALKIGIELTDRCDLRCKHCLREVSGGSLDLDFGLFESIVSQAAALGRFHFAFTGGEPTLHPRFFDCLDVVAGAGLTGHIVTNGHGYPKLRARLKNYRGRLSGISFSLDGADRATHDSIRGSGAFDRVMMGIALAVNDGWSVTVQFVVSRANRNQLAVAASLCGDLGVTALIFAGIVPTPRAVENSLDLPAVELKAVGEEVVELASCSEMPIGVSTGHHDPVPFAHCETLRNLSFNVDVRGNLTFCCQMSGVEGGDEDVVADLSRMSLVDAIDEQMRLVSKINSSRLRACDGGQTDLLWGFHCKFCFDHFGKRADWRVEKGAADEQDR